MRRSLFFRIGYATFCGAMALAIPFLALAQPCGGANQACCPPRNTCNGGLTCSRNGICVSGGSITPITLTNPLSPATDLGAVVTTVLTRLAQLGAPVAAVMVIIGGFQMLFSGGDPEKFARGRKTILYTAIGYGIILLADGVALLIQNLLTP